MIFVLHCKVEPGQSGRLPEFREAHRAHAMSGLVRILGAGPTLSDDGGQIIGGVYIIDADGRAQAQAFYDGDPYVKEGIWRMTLLERYDKRV